MLFGRLKKCYALSTHALCVYIIFGGFVGRIFIRKRWKNKFNNAKCHRTRQIPMLTFYITILYKRTNECMVEAKKRAVSREEKYHLSCCYVFEWPSVYSTFSLCDECVAHLTFETFANGVKERKKTNFITNLLLPVRFMHNLCLYCSDVHLRCNSTFATFSSSFPFSWINSGLLKIPHINTHSSIGVCVLVLVLMLCAFEFKKEKKRRTFRFVSFRRNFLGSKRNRVS